jgi:hypothetical protein
MQRFQQEEEQTKDLEGQIERKRQHIKEFMGVFMKRRPSSPL